MDLSLPSRKSHDAPSPQYRTVAGLATVLTSALHSMLAEADSYSALFESRIKHEEHFISALRSAIEKQNEIEGKNDAKSLAAYSALFASGSATLRATWREFRENQTREIDMRQSLVDDLRDNVVFPLQKFGESQERIRRRVKEDLKVSMADYDQMRDNTLPRLRRTYEKKCEQLEQLRGQQQAIDDQRTLLLSSSSPQVPTMATLRDTSQGQGQGQAANTSDGEEMPAGAATAMSLSNSHQSAPDHQAYSSSGSTSDLLGGGGALNRSDMNLSNSPTSPPLGSEKAKLTFREALRTKEGREAAIKDAPKKFQGFINRMRDGGSDKLGSPGAHNRDSTDSNPLGSSVDVGLVRGPSAAKSIQNIALRVVQVKKESEDADRAYRKAVFDLETLRIRRNKTLAAAVTSVVECRRELNRTAQVVLLQAERAALSTAHASVSVHDRTEGIVENAVDSMAIEAVELESGLTAVMQDDEESIPYMNYWHGRAKVIFGISLTDYAFSHLPGRVIQPPIIITKCISYIEKHGLELQGIYRISARHSSIQALLAAVEKDEEGLDFEVLKPELPAVAGLLKLYLRELPEPVMAMPWEERIRYTHEREENIRTGFATLKGRIRRLPPMNNITLKTIVFHLANVAAHSDKNSMTESNLAVIFGPVLCSDGDHETTSLAAAMEEDRVVEDLIRYAPQVFEAGPMDPNMPASTTATMAHAATLVNNGPDAAPSITIPAVPLSASLPALGSASSSSDQPLLPGTSDLKRKNAILPGEAMSPPRRQLNLPNSSMERPGAPTLPPFQMSPLAPLDLDPMERAALVAASAPPADPIWADADEVNAAEQHEQPLNDNSLVSRSSTVRQPGGPGTILPQIRTQYGSEQDDGTGLGSGLQSGGSGYISPSHIHSATWDEVRPEAGPHSFSTYATASGIQDPWSDALRGSASDDPAPSPSNAQQNQAGSAAPDGQPADAGVDGAGSPSVYPPPVSELIFTRPPPSSTMSPSATTGPPLPPRPAGAIPPP
ncbi:unnamed protein product [Tilletia laevis]|uniref:Rho-GAP domain-containing protein n=3 Tax=Tilletia TaxID=13289 RepID=A0A8X7MMA7_9BASI|nr:hypothetical protein CF336_g5095 [Tilletia laevis]KAE8242019.1 hypothetical protein A4X06_0g7306 [Tilletia controversa]KAE8265137.1 hypothetical protein A4X03_0g451 [Tilletia caries]KAE8198654.1 hypothetical protein CF335_g4339 [Tilletia laevis]CAD6891026.1 unnamed protein product [Tilletia caries]